jgi:hypothetical protein
MRLGKLVVGVCAAAALVAAAWDAGAKGGHGGGKGGGHHGHSHSHHFHGGGYGGYFVASSFVMWPAAYYWPDYQPAMEPVVEYWYYCQPYAAYYPYVQECPAEWQPVLPTVPSPEERVD